MEASPQPQTNERPRLSSSDPQLAESARSMLGEQQRAAASGLGDLAGALRRAARDTNSEGKPVARLAESAADNLERFSNTLRDKDLGALMRDAESFARRQPVAFIGVAALAGFLAVRFLKSSQPDDRT
jgi:hypothetical protein